MKDKIKSGLIVVLIVLIGLFGLFGGKAVSKFKTEIAVLKSDKTRLEGQIALRSDSIKKEQAKTLVLQKTIDSCMKAFAGKNQYIAGLETKLADALSQLTGITSDSSYQFLQHVAYNYPGALKYLFNELQIKGIHTDWLKARNADKEIPALKDQIINCTVQFQERDSLVRKMQGIITLQDQNMKDCKQINVDNDKIIKDQDKTIKRERARKNLWRASTAGSVVAAIIAIAVIL